MCGAKTEIEHVLGEEAALFCEFYDVTEQGNWEHTNILDMSNSSLEEFAVRKNIHRERI